MRIGQGLLRKNRIFLMGLTLTLFGALPGMAEQDTTPPQLVSLSVSPATINVTAAPQTLTATLGVTDDLSGTAVVCVDVQSPSAGQSNGGCGSLTAGNSLNGTWTVTMTVPEFVESGAWKISDVRLGDNAGNFQFLGTAALQALGFATAFNVVSNQDLSPPQLTSFSISPSAIDVSSGQASVNIAMGLSDSPAGVDFNCRPTFCYYAVGLVSPSGQQFQAEANYNVSMVSGTDQNGVWQVIITLPQYAESGNWVVQFVNLYDNAGNSVDLPTSKLQAMGFPTVVAVTSSTPDTTPPQLSNLFFGPNFVDTSFAPQPITVTLGASDNLSGLDFIAGFATPHFNGTFIEFLSPSGNQVQDVNPYGNPFTLLGGSTRNGTWQTNFTLPQFSEAGTWEVSFVAIKDAAGNYARYNTTQLQGMGLPTDLVVVLPSLTPDGTIPPSGGTVQDTVFGARASISFPSGILTADTQVAIDVFTQTLHLPIPSGFSLAGTNFVNIQLTPEPALPLPAPGATITLPTPNQMSPGTMMTLFKVDPITGLLVPEPSVNGGNVVGTVDASGTSATFTGLASLSVVVGLLPSSGVPGDVDGDGKVDCTDIAIVKTSFGKRVGQTGFDSRADVNHNGIVDINDLAFVSRHLPVGTVCRFTNMEPFKLRKERKKTK